MPAARPPAPPDTTLRGDLALAAACALALAAVLLQAFAPPRPRDASHEEALGVVEARSNDVRRRPRGALTWDELRGGEPVHEEDAIYAAEDSQAVILLGDGARIQLEESSLVVVRRKAAPESAASPALALELVRGGAHGLAGGRTLEIRAGGAKVAVDGRGEVRVRRTGEGAVVEVASGQALLASAQGALRLRQGQAVLAGTGGPRVVELAVALSSPAPGASLSFRGTPPAVAFAWRPPRADARCTLEVAATGDFAAPLVRAERAGGQLVHTGLTPGLYHWRVRCDDAGGERWSEQRAFRIVADVPPVALRPLPGEVVDLSQGEPLSLAWSELPEEGGYRVELARDGDFTTPALTVTSRRAALRVVRELPEGRYCFRVQAARGERPDAPWSAPTCFQAITRPLLEAPRTFAPRREPLPEPAPEKGAWLLDLVLPAAHAAPLQSALVLRWERVPGAVAYLLEIAEDRGFTRTVVRERVAEPYFRWKVIARRDYFWHVRAVDADGREGAVSDVSRIGSEVAPPAPEAPAARARLEVAPGGAVWVRWTGSQVLASYRVEVSQDPGFRQGVRTLEAKAPRLALTGLVPGEHHWRVTGVDLNGQSTEPSPARSFVVVPSAPEPESPAAGSALLAAAAPEPVRLAWSARPVARYQVEWAREGEPGVRATVAARAYVLPVTRAGRYTWRVRGLEPDTSWSAPGTFELAPRQPEPGGPADGAELAPGSPVVLSWQPVPLASAYEVLLQPEEGQAQRVQLAETSLDVGPLAPGRYRWSVRAVGAPASAEVPTRSLSVGAPVAGPATASAAAPAPAPAPAPERAARAFGLAVLGGVDTNLGALVAPTLSLEASWRAPQSHGRLGAAVRVGSAAAGQALRPQGLPAVDAQLWSVPIELRAALALPLPWADVIVSAGPLARVVTGTVAFGDGTRLRRTSVELGGAARAGLERAAGPGRVYGELGLTLSSTTQGLFVTTPAALSAGVGYRLEVW